MEKNITLEIIDDKEVTAEFEQFSYALTVDIDGQGSVEIRNELVKDRETMEFEEGTEVELEAVPADSWKFIRWEGDHESEEEEMNLTIEQETEITAVFEDLDPAEFEYSDLTVDPEEPEVGEEIEISIEVSNIGELEGEHTVEFYLDGEEIGNDTVTVAAGETETAFIYHEVEDAQQYRVEVEDESTTFTVEEDEEDTIDGWLIAALILSIIALVVIVWIGMREHDGED